MDNEEIDHAADIFSNRLQSTFPSEPNLGSIDYSKYCRGTWANEFVSAYKRMVLIWEELQQIQLNQAFGEVRKDEYVAVQRRLRDVSRSLHEIIEHVNGQSV